MNYHLTRLSAQHTIEMDPSSLESSLSQEIRHAIDQEWERESHIRPIFNGKIFNVLACNQRTLRGQFVEYKTYLAKLRNSALSPFLPLRILGVTGITEWRNKILIGKRSKNVTLYPGHYEFAPAGGIGLEALRGNQLDLKKQILLELEEEVGIGAHSVDGINPWILAHNEEGGDYQIYLKIKLKAESSFAEISPNPEYASCQWVEKDQLRAFFLKEACPVVPLTYTLLQQI
ncbi:hypothetical protein [Parachlamydia sp. AcF125]|uniref:hypothetical protein n=1 Tax=Parachlamydia sp. AcF125 TaxID=2795736 RepID=UPI001BC9A8E9|nr:hypothetical protein [Parachlamydia sp. AcF125]MBS4168288.1 hypothetical protein [Parachlamydia sp. AcF125]